MADGLAKTPEVGSQLTTDSSVDSYDKVHEYHATLYKMMLDGYERVRRKLQRTSEKRAQAQKRLEDQFGGIKITTPWPVQRTAT